MYEGEDSADGVMTIEMSDEHPPELMEGAKVPNNWDCGILRLLSNYSAYLPRKL